MRDYLYRGFYECSNGNTTIILNNKKIKGKWIEGNYNKVEELNTKNIYEYFIVEVDANGSQYKVIPETVGEYTGKTDKYNRKIFEGDICGCFCNTQIFVVKYCEERCGYFFDDCVTSGYSQPAPECLGNLVDTIEVIGNIFENPQLIQ